MALNFNFNTVHARPDGVHVVNRGEDDETEVNLAPEAEDANALALLAWFRAGNTAHSWPVDLANLRQQKKRLVIAWIDALTGQVTSNFSRDEVAAFGSKRDDAKRHLAGEDASALLVEEAALTGETTHELAQVILNNNEIYGQIIGRVTGLRRETFEAIDAAETPDAVQAAIDAALASASAMARDLGLTVQGSA